VQAMMPELVKGLETVEAALRAIPPIDCVMRDIEDMSNFGHHILKIREWNQWMLGQIDHGSMLKQLRRGRLVYVTSRCPTLAIILENPHNPDEIKAVAASGSTITFNLGELGAIFGKLPKSAEKVVMGNVKKQLAQFSEAPMEWTKVLSTNDFDFVQAAQDQLVMYRELSRSPCFRCSLVERHLRLYCEKEDLLNRRDVFREQMHDESLQFKPLLDHHIDVLRNLGYINEENVLLLKGRVSIEISSCHELLATEVLFSGLFDNLTPPECAAIVSVLVSGTTTPKDAPVIIPPTLAQLLKEMRVMATKLLEILVQNSIYVDENWVDSNVNISLAQIVLDWANGLSFKSIMDITDIPEGSVVRIINMVNETLADFSNAAKIMGCKLLSEKFDHAVELIKRDIIFATSLYFD
jgi:antiviral helicase SKI2